MRAINHALTILSWQENLVTDEMPPEWMWALDDPLEEWFDQVQANRDAKYKRQSSNDDDVVVPLMSNEFARGRGGSRRAR